MTIQEWGRRIVRSIFRNKKTLGSQSFCDAAFTYRMPGGIAGDVTRSHPQSIEPCLQDPTNPVAAFGVGVLTVAASNGVRGVSVGDGSVTLIYGVSVRSYPTQASSASNFGQTGFGPGTPSSSLSIDIIRFGYINVQIPLAQAAVPSKGSTVYIWIAASTGQHVQGGFEAQASGGNTIAITNAEFNGPADSTGIAEIFVRPQ